MLPAPPPCHPVTAGIPTLPPPSPASHTHVHARAHTQAHMHSGMHHALLLLVDPVLQELRSQASRGSL